MEKREYDKQKSRNAEIVSSLIDIENNTENLTDELDIVTEKEFSDFISLNDKIASKGRKSYKSKTKVSKKDLEEAKKDVSSELEKANDTFARLVDIAKKYNLQGTENEEDDFVLSVQKKVYQLYEEAKKRPLTSEEFSDLVEFTRQMNFNELVRNYVDAGLVVTRDKIAKLDRESNNKVFMLFKPVITKFKDKLGLLKENEVDKAFENPEASVDATYARTKEKSLEYIAYIDDVNENLFELLLEDNFEESLSKEFSLTELDNLLKTTDDLKARYDEVNLPTEDGFYPIENISERDVRWSQYADSLINTIGELQAMHLKNCYSDIQKYAVSKTSSGMIACQIGDKFLPISKDHLVDDIALFYSTVLEYENGLKQEDAKEEDKEIVPEKMEDVSLDVKEDEVSDIIVEEPANEEIVIENVPTFDEVSDVIVEEPTNEEVVIEDMPKEEEIVANEEVVQASTEDRPIELEAVEEISPSKQAYIEVMSCFVDRAEAESLATEENVSQFEASNLGYGKYINAINAGLISNDTSYENFVTEQIQKDNGIRYDEPVQEVTESKEDAPIIIENVETTDISGIDKMVSEDDPLAFSDMDQVNSVRRR